MKPILVNTDIDFKTSIEALNLNSSVDSMMVLMSENGNYKIKNIESTIQRSSKTIFGGVFPKIIFESKLYQDGILIVPLSFKVKIISFDLTTPESLCFQRMKALVNAEKENPKSMFLFFDAMSELKNDFIDCLFNFFGASVNYFGSACGSASFKPIQCVITNDGIMQDFGVFALIEQDISLGTAHGWSPISEPYKVTDVKDNEIITLNWMPALELYKRVVSEHSNQVVSASSFSEFSRSYPLGKTKIDGDYSLRHLIAIENNSLKCSDFIEKGEYVSIMYGDKNSLLNSAKEAYKVVRKDRNKALEQDDFIFCIDCMNRELYLKNDFHEELSIIGKEMKVYGALSLGELVNSGDSVLEIYNNSISLALWKIK